MADTSTRYTWPLYVVPDVTAREHILIGHISFDGHWQLTHEPLLTVEDLTPGSALHILTEHALNDFSSEIAAANGEDNGATPLSIARMERRRAFHNNHLRIGPARQEPRHLAA